MNIFGLEIDETKELDKNLEFLREELLHKWSFKYSYQKGINKFQLETNMEKIGFWDRAFFTLALLPDFIKYQFYRKKRIAQLAEAEKLLIKHYEQPSTLIRRSRKVSEQGKIRCKEQLNTINVELEKLKTNYQSSVIGKQTKSQIENLIAAFKTKKEKKIIEHDFFITCENKLREIEERLNIMESINESKEVLEKLSEKEEEKETIEIVKKDTDLFTYYGELIEDITKDMRKVENDSDDAMEELELKELIEMVNNK